MSTKQDFLCYMQQDDIFFTHTIETGVVADDLLDAPGKFYTFPTIRFVIPALTLYALTQRYTYKIFILITITTTITTT